MAMPKQLTRHKKTNTTTIRLITVGLTMLPKQTNKQEQIKTRKVFKEHQSPMKGVHCVCRNDCKIY